MSDILLACLAVVDDTTLLVILRLVGSRRDILVMNDIIDVIEGRRMMEWAGSDRHNGRRIGHLHFRVPPPGLSVVNKILDIEQAEQRKAEPS